MGRLRYTFKTDILFKMLFVQNQDLLKALVSELLEIPLASIEQFRVENESIPPDSLGDKFCRLDINMIVNGQRVDLEVQVSNEGDYPERTLYYWAREYSSALVEGQGYDTLPQTIVISILDFNLFDCEDYHSFFQPLETRRHTLLTDRMGLHFFELRKLPVKVDKNDPLLLWLSLFKANTKEELEKIRALEVPIMDQALKEYDRITASPEFREKMRLYEKARHDEAQALHNAENKGLQKGRLETQIEIAKNLIEAGIPSDMIMKTVGLSREELKNIHE